MAEAIELLERAVYGIRQVERILALKPGTARRSISGYRRQGNQYPAIVRDPASEADIVTWGEFVETRLLAEFRDAGVPVIKMRPAVVRLRELFKLATHSPSRSVP